MTNGTLMGINSPHSVETGLYMLGIDKYTKGEQINW